MSDFKGRHFGGEIVLWAVRWYCRYPICGEREVLIVMSRGLGSGRICGAARNPPRICAVDGPQLLL